MSHLASILPKHPRFTLERLLGRGSTGAVYAALDHQQGERVALKKLHDPDPGGLYRFKKEFRSLADLAHPNLVALYELVADDDTCFFTSELIDGTDLVSWARRNVEPGTITEEDPQALFEQRLRSMLTQLATGVAALHNANILHRDLKPSNVLVDHEGRLVILDFGLATAAEDTSTFDPKSVEAGFAGTLAYMAPEQILGKTSSPASDWYSVGAMLFEAMTGSNPFEGTLSEILQKKTREAARSPSELVPDLPPDLVEVCQDLLTREPDCRLGTRILLELNGPKHSERSSGQEHIAAGLAGRRSESEALADALAAARQGKTVAVFLHGDSGMGKTSLIHGFLEQVASRGEATVLAGRCYERELVPFKALDGVIDRLSKLLLTLDANQIKAVLPEEARPLSRLFPVLRRVEAFDRAAKQGHESPNQGIVRRRAFEGLRSLLRNLGELFPLVVFIDDLHWADADSNVLLTDLLRPQEAPPLLLIASFRSEEINNQTFLGELLSRTDGDRWREIQLAALDTQAARELAGALLPTTDSGGESLIDTIVREAQGSPFFIEQLATYARGGRSTLERNVHLGQLLENWLEDLPAGAESFLITLATAGHPLPSKVVAQSVVVQCDEGPLIRALRQACLIRSSGTVDQLEIYHDRLRVLLTKRCGTADQKKIHRRLANALMDHGVDDPVILFEHFDRSGNSLQASHQAGLAAAKAFEALAFDRAALFYRRILELGRLDDEERLPLMQKEAESLAYAGRPHEAASAFLAAAALCRSSAALDLRSRAAQEYLAGGYLEEGATIMKGVLRSIEMRIPEQHSWALLSLLWQRLRLRRRGLDYVLRNESEISQNELTRIDTCWAAAASLATIQPIQGTELQTRHLRYALDAGEPRRLARALALEASFVARAGHPAREQAKDLCTRTLQLARQVNDPFPLAIGTLHTGLTSYLLGEFRRAAELCDEADQLFGDRCTGAFWDQTTAQRYALASLMFLGELGEIQHRAPVQLAAAEERGNKLGANNLRTRVNISWLAADDPQRALEEAERALTGRDGFHLLHYNGFWARSQADLYRGAPDAAFHRQQELWPRLEQSLLLRIQILQIEALDLKARTLIASSQGSNKSDRLKSAETCIRCIESHQVPYGQGLAALLKASVTHCRRNPAAAAQELTIAAALCRNADMLLHAAAADYQRAKVTDDGEGEQALHSATTFMSKQRVLNPERMANLLIQGFSDLA